MPFDLNMIQNLITKENITFILSIIGSVLSTYLAINKYHSESSKIDVVVTDYFCSKNEMTKQLFIYFIIINKSKMPISITSIDLLTWDVPSWDKVTTDSKVLSFHSYEKETELYRRHSSKDGFINIINSTSLPVSLDSFASISGYFCFNTFKVEPIIIAHKPIQVTFNTNRNKNFSFKYQLYLEPYVKENKELTN
ncbi:hypothetical protein [Eubacterium limosum]|uniref:hypothetical protein n=1 Tax=Eubacterium limosum TaxID=1736 RepID=UPI001062518D|nr:hypothetical protein [Eubacterium limosum]